MLRYRKGIHLWGSGYFLENMGLDDGETGSSECSSIPSTFDNSITQKTPVLTEGPRIAMNFLPMFYWHSCFSTAYFITKLDTNRER